MTELLCKEEVGVLINFGAASKPEWKRRVWISQSTNHANTYSSEKISRDSHSFA